ncbi:hypothetical protein RhiirC2_748408 [Rhizophagus irregularis]|uniref:MACPF domain-containing protein n=1 Tax=Rhizophagus irregularis TaxID=588596 RepID=A0A2N1N6A5_9GLOM|nr:hypothetical protein RhiirC2_748408 [Rhizophagus irregularis]
MSELSYNAKSFFCGFINDDNSGKEISVIINEDPPLARQLNTKSTLECIREQLSNPDEKLCIYDNMSFIGPNGEIERIDESRKSLKETLTGEKGEILKINKSLDYLDKREVIDKYKLEYGKKISEDGLIHSEEKAFEFAKPITNQLIIHKCHKYDHKTKTCSNSYEKYCLEYLIASVNATLPWSPLSVNFSVSHEHNNSETDSRESSTTYDVKDHVRSIIKITSIFPTVKFKQAVEKALESSDSFSELKKITEKFGEYVILEMKLGGKTINIKRSSTIAQQKTNVKSSNGGVKLNTNNIVGGEFSGSYVHGVNGSCSLQEALTHFKIFGGNKNKYKKDDLNEWEDSLSDSSKWEIISYDKIEPIFSILDEELRQKVIKIVIGRKILRTGKDSIKNLKLFPNGSYKHELKIPPSLQSNLRDCQIFASIMNKEKKKDVFSIQVVHSDCSASILLHRISDDDENKPKYYNLWIRWIIIGYPNDFTNVMDEFKVNTSETVVRDTNIQFQKQEFCLLTNCAYKAPKESNSNPFESNIVAGVCFCENSTLKAFTYDLKSKEQKVNVNTFSTHYSLIQIPSESNETYFVFKKKRGFLEFYPRSYSTFVNIKQEQHLWKCDNDLIFFSLLSDNSNLGFACITPKKLLFKPLNETACEQLQISCIRMLA